VSACVGPWGDGFVVVVDPGRQPLQDGDGIRAGLDTGVIAFEGFDEGLWIGGEWGCGLGACCRVSDARCADPVRRPVGERWDWD
jgi:hypothetical protein